MPKNNFDFLRFVFALIVVLSHIVDLSLNPDLLFLKKYFDSHLSVTGFFIISGYLIAGSYVNTKDTRKYFVKRAKRLLPAYIFVVLFAAVMFSFISTQTIATYFSSPQLYKYLLSNLSFLNFLQPCLPGVFGSNLLCTVNGALWTIKVEVSFYLFLPILIYIIHRFDRKFWVFGLLYFLGLNYQFGLKALSLMKPEKAAFFEVLQHQLPGFLTYFMAGISLYYFKDIFQKYRNSLSLISLLVFVIEYYFNWEVFRPIAMAILILYCATGFKFLNNFGRYGDFSYGIYIYHFPLIQTAVSLQLFQLYPPFLVGFAILVCLGTMAYVSWILLEKRFLQRTLHKQNS